MLKVELYNPFYCPIEHQDENNKQIEAILASKATYAEKAFIRYALSDPETIKIKTEYPIKRQDRKRSLKCDFKLYFINGVEGYHESNGIDHFAIRKDESFENYRKRLIDFTDKQEQMREEGKNVLNINFITSYVDKNNNTPIARKNAYLKAVQFYTNTPQFKVIYDRLKNPRLNRNLNMTIAFDDVFAVTKCGDSRADRYTQSLLDNADVKYIEKMYETPKKVENSYRFR